MIVETIETVIYLTKDLNGLITVIGSLQLQGMGYSVQMYLR